MIFSAPHRALIFCVHIPFVYEHLFYKYFVRLSVGQATKGKRASILMDVVILVLEIKVNVNYMVATLPIILLEKIFFDLRR